MLKLTILCVLVFYATAHPLSDNNRIVNGTNAKLGEIPYIVSLRSYGSHSCGGSILDKRHILTAAHCIDYSKPESLSIQYGVTNINLNLNVIQVSQIYKHEGFSPSTTANDVAVLKLAEDIIFNNDTSVVELPEQDEKLPGGNWAVLAGWGLNKSGGSVQRDLKRVDILIYTDDDCSKAHGSGVDSRYHVCSGIPEGGKGQCNGDSGGPLVADGKQWGVVSWSIKPCTVKGYPGVFARVSSYVDWIKSKQQLIVNKN